MIDSAAPLVPYTDRYLSLRHPRYLKCAGRTGTADGLQYVFRPQQTSRRADESIVLVAAVSESQDWGAYLDTQRHVILNYPKSFELDNEMLQMTVLRSGQSPLRRDAVEIVVAGRHKKKDRREYGWQLIFSVDAGSVEVKINALGEFPDDEARWTQVIQSIEFRLAELDETAAQLPGPATHPKRRRRKDTKRIHQLRTILQSLPEELNYLIEPIVDAARQPSDDLVTGDADTTSLDEALRVRLGGLSRTDARQLCESDRIKLEEWLINSGHREDMSVVGPVYFVTGILLATGSCGIDD